MNQLLRRLFFALAPALLLVATSALPTSAAPVEVKVTQENFQTPPVTFPGIIQLYQGVSSETAQSVSFYSFNNGNVEVFVKMVDACATPSNAFWLFAAGATNAKTSIFVRDTVSGLSQGIFNPSGQLFQTVANTQAFKTCAQGG